MSYLLYVLALGLAPVIFVFTFVYLKDRYEREPLKHLIWSFVFGVLIALPAVFGEIFLQSALKVSDEEGSNVVEVLIYAMVVVAAVEEGLKFLVLRFYMYNKPEFDEPYDGIMYAVAVSLGFAAIENILYIAQFGAETGWLRMFTAVPGHAMFAVVMGFFVGKAKFMTDRGKATLEMGKGLLAAVVIHGLYDFFLMVKTNYVLVPLLAFVVLIVGIILGLKAIKAHGDDSPFKKGKSTEFDLLSEEMTIADGQVTHTRSRLTGTLIEEEDKHPGPDADI
ncbi:MAG: PrsW family intramembrane metalloprotease [Bacteroidia bacterium]|nr:PrsW family intramembrane metalloprotease [Bacteroidia bacterium]